MQFNQATDYAFRIIMHLAELAEGELANSQAIAEQQNIPTGFLQKIMHSLVKGDLVKSYRGVDGGFALAKQAEEISLLDVIEVMEGPLDLQRCLKQNSSCSKGCATTCPVHASLSIIQTNFTQALKEVNFAKLVKENKEER